MVKNIFKILIKIFKKRFAQTIKGSIFATAKRKVMT